MVSLCLNILEHLLNLLELRLWCSRVRPIVSRTGLLKALLTKNNLGYNI